MVDRFVDAFESARTDRSTVDLRAYLPEPDHPGYLDVLTELVRIDLEHQWAGGARKRLDDYRQVASELFDDAICVERAAFEEYRLRCQAGELVDREEYRLRYNVDTSGWPVYAVLHSSIRASRNGDNSARNQRGLERLADAATEFPASGASFAGFELLEELGRGSFARVFMARQRDLADRLVVLKISSDASLEPQHLARLQHTNIVPIYSVHQHGGLRGVCMPYFGSATLADVLRCIGDKPSLPASGQELFSTLAGHDAETLHMKHTAADNPPRQTAPTDDLLLLPGAAHDWKSLSYVQVALRIGEQIAAGLAHAHECGIVHRDLKPANVLLAENGRPMLLDFNLSEEVVVGGRAALVVGGTLPYMAPEHLSAVVSSGCVDRRSDVYSLGVLLFEMLTGRRPFPLRAGDFDSMIVAMIADRQAGAPAIRTLNPAVPRSVASIVRRCLEYDPQNRYSSAAALHEDLNREINSQPLRHARDRSLLERGQKWARRHPRWTSGGAVATVATAALLVASFLLWASHLQIARWQAADALTQFHDALQDARLSVTMPDADQTLLLDGSMALQAALAKYRVLDDPQWQENPRILHLAESDRQHLDDELSELMYLLAETEIRLAKSQGADRPDKQRLRTAVDINRRAIDIFPPGQAPHALIAQRRVLLSLSGSAIPSRDDGPSSATESETDTYLTALQSFGDGRFEAALGPLTALRDRHPADPCLWFVLGNTHVGLNSQEEAIACYTACLALQPRSYAAYLYRGLAHYQLRKFPAALRDFERAVELRPRQPACLLNRALAHQALGNYQQAVDDLTRALASGATDTRIYFLRADLFDKLRDDASAKRDREMGLRLEPTDEKSWIARGVAKLDIDPAQARVDFAEALRRYPGSQLALTNLLHVLGDRLGEHQEAMAVLEQLLARNPDDPAALAGRAVLAARSDQRQLALGDLRRLLDQPQTPTTLFQAACALAQLSNSNPDDAQQALQLLRQAIQRDVRLAERANTDPDLSPLRGNAQFKSLLAAAAVLNGQRSVLP
jgi:serine/threonine protein kinase/predicted Zn-dependent protease